jgi:hypothetical protein
LEGIAIAMMTRLARTISCALSTFTNVMVVAKVLHKMILALETALSTVLPTVRARVSFCGRPMGDLMAVENIHARES